MSETVYVQIGSYTLKTVEGSEKKGYRGPKRRGSFKVTRDIKAGDWISISEFPEPVETEDGKKGIVNRYQGSIQVK